jgi:hypothetical protein
MLDCHVYTVPRQKFEYSFSHLLCTCVLRLLTKYFRLNIVTKRFSILTIHIYVNFVVKHPLGLPRNSLPDIARKIHLRRSKAVYLIVSNSFHISKRSTKPNYMPFGSIPKPTEPKEIRLRNWNISFDIRKVRLPRPWSLYMPHVIIMIIMSMKTTTPPLSQQNLSSLQTTQSSIDKIRTCS